MFFRLPSSGPTWDSSGHGGVYSEIDDQTRKYSTFCCRTRDVILDERAVPVNIEGHRSCLFSHGRYESVFRTLGEVKRPVVSESRVVCVSPAHPCKTNIANKENANIDVFLRCNHTRWTFYTLKIVFTVVVSVNIATTLKVTLGLLT